ncbi:hypothetical protein NDU88_006709 [Pleurodeles waltl]|uniref:Uncharacterized protein n=1 Tax=Pleurodeles waltl TaxID=8319 RepID=A0AAV7WYC5_PLEWA|nr:hypothetical protein NDU88_006709 [Pleurodeles waltl]
MNQNPRDPYLASFEVILWTPRESSGSPLAVQACSYQASHRVGSRRYRGGRICDRKQGGARAEKGKRVQRILATHQRGQQSAGEPQRSLYEVAGHTSRATLKFRCRWQAEREADPRFLLSGDCSDVATCKLMHSSDG